MADNHFGGNVVPGVSCISRERSFIRSPSGQNLHNANKRRSLALQQQNRGKPTLELYRPPTNNNMAAQKLNIHAPEFTMQRNEMMAKQAHNVHHHMAMNLQHSKSSGNMHFHNMHLPLNQLHQHRPAMYNQMQMPVQPLRVPILSSVGESTHQPRVKFAPDPPNVVQIPGKMVLPIPNPLQRSKSLTSADNLISRSIAGLSLTADINDIGTFSPAIQATIDKALVDPNQLSVRSLMELASGIMERAVEGRRYSLPISKLCITIIAKEKKETFLEAILNTCRQWYNERDAILGGAAGNVRSPGRPRFLSFMSFLTEMFCQLKRRQLQLRTQCDGAPPPMVLLTLLEKCCEDCVKPPTRSLSEIECLFFVLTCIGKDLELHLPQQLDVLLTKIRDSFLNSDASAPAIRRTLLQLIELQASHWQLPGNTVLYYYPTTNQRQNIYSNTNQ